MKQIFYSIALLSLCFTVNAQIIPRDIVDRINASNYIFEATVIRSDCYWDSIQRHIYTSNTLRIHKNLKGHLQCGEIEVLTQGGTIGNISQTVSHSVVLRPGQKGIFLCVDATTIEHPDSNFYDETNPEVLEVVAEEQGYLRYTNDEINPIIRDWQFHLDSLAQVYNLLELYSQLNFWDCDSTGLFDDPLQFLKRTLYPPDEYDMMGGGSANDDTFYVELTNYSISGSTIKHLEFDLSIGSNHQPAYLHRLGFNMEYDTAQFGSNIVASGGIEVFRGDMVSDPSKYPDIELVDSASNIMRLRIAFTTDTSQSRAVFPLAPQYAIHMKLRLVDCVDSPNFNLRDFFKLTRQNGVPTGPGHYGAIDEVVTYESDSMDCANTQISFFEPDYVHGGVYDTVNVYGSQFDTIPGKIYLQNADGLSTQYIPIDSADIIRWSDSLITFYVPSNVYDNSSFEQACIGTGKIKIETINSDTAESANELFVYWSIFNSYATNGTADTSKYPVYLINPLDDVYLIHPDTSIANYSDRLDALEKAIHDWSCATHVNLELGASIIVDTLTDDNLVSWVKVGVIQNALPSTYAETVRITSYCPAAAGFDERYITASHMTLSISQINNIFFDIDPTVSIPPGKADGYHMLLHELDHSQGIEHINDSTKIMDWFAYSGPIPAASRKIHLDQDPPATDCSSYLVNTSVGFDFTGCFLFVSPMTPLYPTNCTNSNSVAPVNVGAKFILYPNPSNNYFDVKAIDGTQNFKVEIYNTTGLLIKTVGCNSISQTVTLQDLPAGQYLVRLSDLNNSFTLPLTIIH